MRELNVNEVSEVSGGNFVILAAVTVVTAALQGAYAVGEMVGEIAQREYEANNA